jgi:hypothetical protein
MRLHLLRKIRHQLRHLSRLTLCTVCFGDPNSSMVAGLNAGILSLLAVLIVLLSFFAFLFLQIRKRSKLLN